jgi:CBS domain containing-hemolysin-like protein
MQWDLPRLVNRPARVSGVPLSPERAARRISAYIHGNILVLAALIPVTKSEDTFGIAIVVGAAASTYLAHVFAESVAQTLTIGRTVPTAQRTAEFRDGLPIITSAVLPIVLLLAALIGWLEPKTAQLLAELVMILRIASISYVIGRVRHEKVTTGTHLAAFAIALAGCLVVALKLVLT